MTIVPHFDPISLASSRLEIFAMRAVLDTAEFGAVRESIGVSDSVLSKHVRQLEEAGYVKLTKATVASRMRTWLSLTRAGKAAFKAHVAELEKLAAHAGALAD